MQKCRQERRDGHLGVAANLLFRRNGCIAQHHHPVDGIGHHQPQLFNLEQDSDFRPTRPKSSCSKAGWWLKAVQLDLEAKRIIQRGPGKPVRLFKCL
ncbi:DUF6958 family protein [Rhizobium brockwellii]